MLHRRHTRTAIVATAAALALGALAMCGQVSAPPPRDGEPPVAAYRE